MKIRVFFIALWCCVPMALHADQQSLFDWVDDLHSEDWRERAAAAWEIVQSPQAAQSLEIRREMVDLLDRENRMALEYYRQDRLDELGSGQGYGDYQSGLINDWFIHEGELRERDLEALEVLAQSTYNPDSRLATMIADAGGSELVPALLDLAADDREVRIGVDRRF